MNSFVTNLFVAGVELKDRKVYIYQYAVTKSVIIKMKMSFLVSMDKTHLKFTKGIEIFSILHYGIVLNFHFSSICRKIYPRCTNEHEYWKYVHIY